MTPEEFEKYFERIEELYKIGKLCENPTISIHIVHSKIRKQKLKEILEEIYKKGYDACDESKSLQRWLIEITKKQTGTNNMSCV